MMRRVALAACAVVLLAATAVSAQQVVTGTVVRVDPSSNVVVLDNGQMYRTTPQTVYLVNNQPVAFSTIAPGTPVVVQSGQPVMYQNGQYVVVNQPVVVGQPAAVAAVPVATTSPFETSGVVRWVGPSSITLDDGRQIWIDESTQLTASGSPVMLSTLKPGTFVVVRSTKPFASRDNRTYYTTTAPVGVAPVSGSFVRLDQPNMIVLSDGRVIPATTQTVVMVDNRAVPYTALRPGTPVVIYPNGQAAVVGDPYAFPAPVPESGIREKEMERNSP